MKTSVFAAALCLFHASLLPAAELLIEPDTLTPDSTIEVRFDSPMVDKEKVGTVEKTSPLTAEPAITGEFKWTSTRSGQFRFTRAPAFATVYAFSLRSGLKDASGSAVPAQKFGEFSTESLRIVDEWRDYPYSSGDSAQRVPLFIFQFNDAVDPAALTKQAYMTNKGGGVRLPVTARLATGKDLKRRYYGEIVQTWDERVAGIKPAAAPGETRPNAVVIQTREPLPVGTEWTLVLPATVKNTSGTASLAEQDTRAWGDVLPLQIKRLTAETHFDGPHSVEIAFNKQIVGPNSKPEEAAARVAPFVKVEPPVPGMKIETSYTTVTISGDFTLHQPYTVILSPGLPGADGLPFESGNRETVNFQPSEVFVSTTASTNSQLASGHGLFDIYAANFKDLRIRVKQLSEGELIKARALYQETYEPWDTDDASASQKIKDTPFESFPGKVVYDTTVTNDRPLEKSTFLQLKWSEVLGQTPAAPVFIEMVATSHPDAPQGTVVNRAIVEFTDIGLLVKTTEKETFAYAFSLRTGEPLPDVQLTFTDKDRGFLKAAKTDGQGMASLPLEGAAWLLASKGADCTALHYEDGEGSIGLWGQDINIAWDSPWKLRHETFLFADRPVYKPGDTAHVKAIARMRSGDSLTLSGKPLTATLTVTDDRNREILTKTVTFTANGTWADDITFPEEQVGWYNVRLKYQSEDEAAKPEADEEEEDPSRFAQIQLRVDEYKASTFEVDLQGEAFKVAGGQVTVPLTARYYMGKPLSTAKANWSASLTEDYVPPASWSQYHFGDAPAWWNYGKDLDDETAGEEEPEEETWSAHGSLTLNDDGTASIELPEPPPHKAALPQTVNIYADVTDVNQQTIAVSTEFKLPGADFLLGAKKQSWFATVGKPFHFDFAAITAGGEPFRAPVGVDVKIERLEWNTVRVEGAGGAITTRNQSTLVEEFKSSVKLASINGQASSGTLGFTPKKGGTYFLTATSVDAGGRTVFTRVPFYSLGGGGFPWSWEDGAQITLQPDKTTVKPGDEVTLVVKSPIPGKALVTIERNRVHRQFLAPVSPENPVIKFKVTEEDAPNAFVSVIVIRGAADSPQPDPMPEYKVGYCEITVNSDARKLFVDVQPSAPTVKPGGELTVNAVLTDAGKKPVAGAEVALYAVDEGVLSLMDYQTPEPFEFFHMSMPLGVNNHTTLDSLLEEAMGERYRGNKGVQVGGGGEESDASDALRKNFVATALWSATLITDEAGRVSATFKAPDSLTRYRLMAVAVKDADRFGTGESAFVVNKPLMVEPVVPRFAHVGDELLLKAVVHNTTPHSGEVEVELVLDDTAVLITEERPFVMIAAGSRTLAGDGGSERRTLKLKAGETAAVPFPVRLVKEGTTAWQWRVRTTKWAEGAPALDDSVESKFEVIQPAPSLREVHYFQLGQGAAVEDLLKQVNPQLLESNGKVTVSFSQSRLYEARDALEQTLHYPYGCLEQTTSATLPWLTLTRYDTMFPDLLDKSRSEKAIRRGVNRILSMQTDDGGFAYWPGGDHPVFWGSAYAGFALLKARDAGVPVPQESLDKLMEYLSKGLRELQLASSKDTHDMTSAALALYTLAKADRTEPAYSSLLYQRRDQLPETARLFLALSMCVTDAPAKQIKDLLKAPAKRTDWHRHWLAPQLSHPLRLLAATHLGLTAEAGAAATELLRSRRANGDWGTTFGNAWSLTALTAADRTAKDSSPLIFNTAWGSQTSEVNLPTTLSSKTLSFDLTKGGKAPALTVQLPGGRPLLARLEVKSWPDIKTFQPVTKGFTIKRRYERLTPVGTREPATNLRVGDLIVVTLGITVHQTNRYLAIDDPLPSVFEPVNPEFVTQNQRADAAAEDNSWFCDYRELRHDRAVFFTDEPPGLGTFELRYLARVIAEGDVVVPPARIEAMYQPDHYGLSEIQHVQTLPMSDGSDVAKK